MSGRGLGVVIASRRPYTLVGIACACLPARCFFAAIGQHTHTRAQLLLHHRVERKEKERERGAIAAAAAMAPSASTTAPSSKETRIAIGASQRQRPWEAEGREKRLAGLASVRSALTDRRSSSSFASNSLV